MEGDGDGSYRIVEGDADWQDPGSGAEDWRLQAHLQRPPVPAGASAVGDFRLACLSGQCGGSWPADCEFGNSMSSVRAGMFGEKPVNSKGGSREQPISRNCSATNLGSRVRSGGGLSRPKSSASSGMQRSTPSEEGRVPGTPLAIKGCRSTRRCPGWSAKRSWSPFPRASGANLPSRDSPGVRSEPPVESADA